MEEVVSYSEPRVAVAHTGRGDQAGRDSGWGGGVLTASVNEAVMLVVSGTPIVPPTPPAS